MKARSKDKVSEHDGLQKFYHGEENGDLNVTEDSDLGPWCGVLESFCHLVAKAT